MRNATPKWRILVMVAALGLATPALATDVDGPDDCQKLPVDFGDAPEGVEAYPGVAGHFPTCVAPGAPGTTNLLCGPGGPAPGPTGFVRHARNATSIGYWLGCGIAGFPPHGIDSEPDAKMNVGGAPFSTCNTTVAIDCVEAAFGLSFGQDECYGTNDAGLPSAVSFGVCASENVRFQAYFCGPGERQVMLNVLVDWNQDGDWNDEFPCALGCSREWAVRNVPVVLVAGCNTILTPNFVTGPNAGRGWMRITLSDEAAPADFSWNGSAGMVGQTLTNGETEDYPVTIQAPCPPYEDWGDAPEDALAYPGVIGNFPTCSAPGGIGTQDTDCAAISTPPGPTGFVRHLSSPTDPLRVWLGCGAPGVDSEVDGKMNDTGKPASQCHQAPVDCTDFFGINWGQDECYGDGVDAGLGGPTLVFKTCQSATVDFRAFHCGQQADAFLNILVDMNQDGDWNDNFQCTAADPCAYEWAVKNVPIPLGPGCQSITSPAFMVGPRTGRGWLRITLTAAPVSDDFPWNGSAGPAGDEYLLAGETEDYPVMIRPDFVGVDDPPGSSPLALAPLSPNPAGGQVTVRFTLPQSAEVSLAAYDVAGRELAELARGRHEAGEHRVTWNFTDRKGRMVPAGYYLVKLRVGDRVLTQRGIRVR